MTCWNAWQTLSPDLLVLILFSVKFLPARAANFVKKIEVEDFTESFTSSWSVGRFV